MCKFMKRIVPTLVCMLTALCMLTITVSAATYKLNVSDQALWEASEDLDTAATDLGLSNNGGVLEFDESNFVTQMTDKQQKATVKNFMDAVIEADISADGTTTIMDALNTAETIDMSVYLIPYMFDELKGDVIGGAKVMSPFIPIMNVVIGAAAIIILLLLIVYTVYDLLIIVVPALREKIVEKSGGENKRPAYVSEAAWSAIKAAESAIGGDGTGYKSALWVYFKRRLPEYIVMGIIIAFLVLGGFSNLLQALLALGSNYTG